MSDEEEVVSGSEEEEVSAPAPVPRKPVAAKQVAGVEGLDDESRVLLQDNANMRAEMEAEIEELKARSIQRKKEREEEEKRLAAQRAEEDRVRKEQEEERKRAKEEEENKRKAERMAKLAEFEKMKNPTTPNFVIKKKEGGGASAGGEEGDDEEGKEGKKSKEQLEAEKKAILDQRIKPLNIDGFDEGKLAEKAKELYKELFKLECDKYDLEKRFKEQQYDMMELAERARSVNKVGKGGLKRVQLGQDESDPIQEKFSSAPAKIIMFSQFERQMDKRGYKDRKSLFGGANFIFPAERIKAERKLIWNEAGLPEYEELPEGEGGEEAAAEE